MPSVVKWSSRSLLDSERKVWNALPSVPAVRNNRVYLLTGDEFVVPGPRITIAADRFPMSPRVKWMRAILNKLDPPAPKPVPFLPLKPPGHSRAC